MFFHFLKLYSGDDLVEKQNLWDKFYSSGKVSDYLEYKNVNFNNKEESTFEPYNNKRPDNQGTKGWRG